MRRESSPEAGAIDQSFGAAYEIRRTGEQDYIRYVDDRAERETANRRYRRDAAGGSAGKEQKAEPDDRRPKTVIWRGLTGAAILGYGSYLAYEVLSHQLGARTSPVARGY